MVKIVRLHNLQRRLRSILDDKPQLAISFERALADQDEEALAQAFEILRSSPNDVRLAVEGAILDWLFGSERVIADDDFREQPTPSATVH
ncbi:MAG: hypothetical protein EA356_08995 [Geminicoccaceae bacterium]|nr:MAG: hypothetical protein EA356_08995 [Geminicoccaceae bacterium]